MSPVTDGNSYWMASVPPTRLLPHLSENLEVDVCIIGGGITGLLCANELAEAGLGVIVLEAHRLASSVTGYTTAKVTSQHGLRYHRLTEELGVDAARAYGRANQDALDRIRQIVADLNIDADLQTRDAYVYATRPDGIAELRAEASAAAEAGLPASFTTEVPVPFATTGAVRFADQAQVHPRKLLLGLASHLRERGVRIFENSEVTAVEHRGRWIVTSAGGTVTADAVVAAALTPVAGIGDDLWEHLYCHQGFAVALPLLGEGPGGVLITHERPMRSIRTITGEDGPLLQVGGAAFVEDSNHGDTPYHDLEAWAREHFEVGEATYRWTTQDNSTSDGVPLIGRLDTRGLYFAGGFGGWGMTTAGVAAAIIRDLIAGAPGDGVRDRIFDPRRPMPPIDAGLISRHTSSGTDRDALVVIGALRPGEAAVVRHDGEQLGVHRRADGELDVVSAVCTHAGCIVLWDAAGTHWACPCHGSQFQPDGSLIRGPAEAPLPRRPALGSGHGDLP